MHRLALLTSAATLVLIVAGGLVTSTGSALAVPDWPLSYGQVFPPMVGGVLYEHGHRMIATAVGFLTAVLTTWILLRERRRWVGRIAVCALLAVVLQGVLGGITVLFLLPTAVSVAHACLAQAFFCLTVTLAVVTGAGWTMAPAGAPAGAGASTGGRLTTLTVILTGAVYLQLILGAVMRHIGAGLAIPDFPLAFGRIIPPLDALPVAIHFAHRAWAVVVSVLAVWTAARIARRHRHQAGLHRPAILLLSLLAAQIALGAATIWTRRAVLPATAHVACGAALLATSVVLMLRSFRLGQHDWTTPFPRALRYVALVKPRVVLLILVTTLVGFVMASGGAVAGARFDPLLLMETLVATGLAAAGTLALNQYLERDTDALMRRTSRRPLPGGEIRPVIALGFGTMLICAGLLLQNLLVNSVSAMVTALTVISYLFLYTPLKRRSALCTLVGAFPGALPPVAGWTAAGGSLGLEAAVLFGILFFWQLPHSLAIAQLYRDDYATAGMRLLPTVDRTGGSTGRQTVANCLCLLAIGLLPTLIGMAGWAYFLAALALGSWMLWQGAALALRETPLRARRLLYATYLYIPIVLATMAVDRIP